MCGTRATPDSEEGLRQTADGDEGPPSLRLSKNITFEVGRRGERRGERRGGVCVERRTYDCNARSVKEERAQRAGEESRGQEEGEKVRRDSGTRFRGEGATERGVWVEG